MKNTLRDLTGSSSIPENIQYRETKQAPRTSEKLSFSQTCSLLSKYLAERGSFGEYSPPTPKEYQAGMNARKTMKLFPGVMDDVESDSLHPTEISENCVRPLDLFPNAASSDKCGEPSVAPMTIFYKGNVIVFEDYSAEKAKEIMHIANLGSSGFQSRAASPENSTAPIPMPFLLPIHPNASTIPVACDLPQSRRASLHRFLEKRRDRVASRDPYPRTTPVSAPQNSSPISPPWFGLNTAESRLI